MLRRLVGWGQHVGAEVGLAGRLPVCTLQQGLGPQEAVQPLKDVRLQLPERRHQHLYDAHYWFVHFNMLLTLSSEAEAQA